MIERIIIDTGIGLFMLLYFCIIAFTIYLAATKKFDPHADAMGRLLWLHGLAWILILIVSCAGTGLLIMSQLISKVMGV